MVEIIAINETLQQIASSRLFDHSAIGVLRRLGSGPKADRTKENGLDGGWPIALTGWPVVENCVF
jgi:hypothetical protein